MSRDVPIKIIPTRATETISISAVDYLDKFRHKFTTKQAVDFFVFGKSTIGNNIYLEIRSMRVNEFVYMLDEFGIRWRHITEAYKWLKKN